MTRQDFVREVYDVSYRRLVVQLFALTGDLAEAEDAVQEAFVAALGKSRASTNWAIPRPGCARSLSTTFATGGGTAK